VISDGLARPEQAAESRPMTLFGPAMNVGVPARAPHIGQAQQQQQQHCEPSDPSPC
jgi:hypothetical protein